MAEVDPDTIFWAVIGFMWAEFLWEGYIGRRQRAVYRDSTVVPPELDGILDQDTFTKARLYALDKSVDNYSKI